MSEYSAADMQVAVSRIAAANMSQAPYPLTTEQWAALRSAPATIERLEAELKLERQTTTGMSDRKLSTEVERLKAALVEIAKGDGAFNRDRLTHADNCIENMKSIALAAMRSKGDNDD